MPVTQGLGWTFNTQAEKYEKMRPGYVPELYEDVFRWMPLDETSRVVEIGIGGGQATRPILETGCQLTAVECGENLAEVCREKFSAYQNFSVMVARFEDAAFEKKSCDLIYSASAFHWIPEEIGYTKVYDMLRPGGVFARFANHPYHDKGRPGLPEAIQDVYRVYMPRSSAPGEYGVQDAAQRADIAHRYGFEETAYYLYHRTRTFTAKEYTELLGTYSDHIAIEETTRRRFFAEIEAAINAFGGEITIYDTIDLELARKL